MKRHWIRLPISSRKDPRMPGHSISGGSRLHVSAGTGSRLSRSNTHSRWKRGAHLLRTRQGFRMRALDGSVTLSRCTTGHSGSNRTMQTHSSRKDMRSPNSAGVRMRSMNMRRPLPMIRRMPRHFGRRVCYSPNSDGTRRQSTPSTRALR